MTPSSATSAVRSHRRLANVVGDRSQFYKDLAIFFMAPTSRTPRSLWGFLASFWHWSMQCDLLNADQCIKHSSETDFTEDLQKFDTGVLVNRPWESHPEPLSERNVTFSRHSAPIRHVRRMWSGASVQTIAAPTSPASD